MKLTSGATESSQVACEILAYLTKHPDARDTVEGIVEWWLLEQHIERQTTLVKAALDALVASELVLERKGEDQRTYYRLNQRRRREISALLQERFAADGEHAPQLKNRVGR